MAATQPPSASARERAGLGELILLGAVALIAAVGANTALQMVAVGVFDISAEFLPLTPIRFVGFTAAGVIGAVLVFAMVARRSDRPLATFRTIAIAVLLISFVPDLALPFLGIVSGASVPAVVTLMLMHVTTAALSVGLLTGLTTIGWKASRSNGAGGS